jgi:hypothetical protein
LSCCSFLFRENHLAAIGCLDLVLFQSPVFGVGDRACRGCLDVKMVDAEVVERGVGIGADVECAACAGGLDIPDVNVAEVGQPLLLGTLVVSTTQYGGISFTPGGSVA